MHFGVKNNFSGILKFLQIFLSDLVGAIGRWKLLIWISCSSYGPLNVYAVICIYHTHMYICIWICIYMYMEICVHRGIHYVWRHVYIEVYLNFVWSYMKDFPQYN